MRAGHRSRRKPLGAVFFGLLLTVALVAPAGSSSAQAVALVPVGLRLDHIANGVIEPGEFPIMAPAWENVSPDPMTATGTVSNFTGPPGATYGFLIPTADYGTIPGQSTASCWEQTGDCYVLAINDPTTRPAVHWDATILETLSTGETKTWTLHIGRTFADVSPTGPYYRFVETLVHNAVTSGCNTKTPPWFCPKSTVTRGQMAAFLLKSIEGGDYVPPQPSSQRFADVPPSNRYYALIEQMAVRGITAGCDKAPPRYCPNDPVTREQMAAFLLKAREGGGYVPPQPTAQRFTDVPPSNPFYAFIEQLAFRGITAGCDENPPRYCPRGPVTREQMAVFLTYTFSLVLYGP